MCGGYGGCGAGGWEGAGGDGGDGEGLFLWGEVDGCGGGGGGCLGCGLVKEMEMVIKIGEDLRFEKSLSSVSMAFIILLMAAMPLFQFSIFLSEYENLAAIETRLDPPRTPSLSQG